MFKKLLRFLVSPCPVSLGWLPWVLCVAGLMIDAVIRFPGAIHGMVGISIKESLLRNYTDWHPPIFAFTFYVTRVLFYEPFGLSGTGQGVLYLIETVLFWFAVLLIGCYFQQANYHKTKNKPVWFVMLTVFCTVVIFCDMILLTGQLNKDFLFFVCYFFAAALLLNMPEKLTYKIGIGIVVLFFLFYGTALRHNAVFALFPMLLWLVWSFNNNRFYLVALTAFILWGYYLGLNHFLTYDVLRTSKTYVLRERFYGDIFILNYFGDHYKNPPNTFGCDFDKLDQTLFRKEYQYRCMYVPEAFRVVGKNIGCEFPPLVVEGYTPPKEGISMQQQKQNLQDFVTLRNEWFRRISLEPLLYFRIRCYYVLRFLFIDTPILCFALSGGFINGVAVLTITLLFCVVGTFSKNRFLPGMFPSLMLAYSSALYTLPLFMFLPEDGPGNIRYLFWFFAASYLSIALSCANSPLFAEITQTVQRYWERKIDGKS